MQIIYLSNYFNHHQKPLSDTLYEILGENYRFVETKDVPKYRKDLGYHELSTPYLLKYNEESRNKISQLINEADVVIYGEAPLSLIKKRVRDGKLTFRDDESRYKNPNRYLKWPVYTYKSLWLNKCYLLAASAFAPIDYMLSGLNPARCYRWGYFTEYKRFDINELMNNKLSAKSNCISILWVGRLIPLKHPEMAIKVASYLKKQGINFKLDIIGCGSMERQLRDQIDHECLGDIVNLLGSMSHVEVRKHMEQADIFLFTSDRREGWGAVLNESMNSACAVVADSNIGAVPYLVEDNVNGLVYKSASYPDLCKKVEWLINHPDKIREMGINAYHSIAEYWNEEIAAKHLIDLCSALLNGKDTPIINGPCSKAPLLMRKWRGRFKIL